MRRLIRGFSLLFLLGIYGTLGSMDWCLQSVLGVLGHYFFWISPAPLPCSGLFSACILSPCCFCCAAALLVWASEWTDPVPSMGGQSAIVQGGDCSPLCPACTQPSLPGPGSGWSPQASGRVSGTHPRWVAESGSPAPFPLKDLFPRGACGFR